MCLYFRFHDKGHGSYTCIISCFGKQPVSTETGKPSLVFGYLRETFHFCDSRATVERLLTLWLPFCLCSVCCLMFSTAWGLIYHLWSFIFPKGTCSGTDLKSWKEWVSYDIGRLVIKWKRHVLALAFVQVVFFPESPVNSISCRRPEQLAETGAVFWNFYIKILWETPGKSISI